MMNVGLAIIQYMSPMLLFMGLGVISIHWPQIGGVIHIGAAILAAWFFNIFTNTVIIFILVPLIGIGLSYLYGSSPPRKVATQWMIGLPILVAMVAGSVPAYRVSQRITERNLDAQIVQGNEIMLRWAPRGPGWPLDGTDWYEAVENCRMLDSDGETTGSEPQNVWRLPTAEEAVRSMALHGENSGGIWDAQEGRASYKNRPDKEYPIWDIYSQVIYMWTATELDQENAYIIVYDGKIWPRAKQLKMGYLGFRCVK